MRAIISHQYLEDLEYLRREAHLFLIRVLHEGEHTEDSVRIPVGLLHDLAEAVTRPRPPREVSRSRSAEH